MIHTVKLCAVAYSVGKHVHIASICMHWLLFWAMYASAVWKVFAFIEPVVASIPYAWEAGLRHTLSQVS